MQKTGKTIAGVLAASTMVLTALPLGQAVDPSHGIVPEGAGVALANTADQETVSESGFVDVQNVQGTFSWNQEATADTSFIRKAIYEGASKHLCGVHDNVSELAVADAAAQGAEITSISVTGSVRNAFVANVGEYEKKAPAKATISCTCAGNPADGIASANASVKGFMLAALLKDAQPASDANAITFVSADGYEVMLPLSYVRQRQCLMVTQINDTATADALGCQNQLWLGATSARSFVQDVVSIRITCEKEAPAAPGTEGYNQPNVGVVAGEASS